MYAWTIKQLYEKLHCDLKFYNGVLERDICRAAAGMNIRELAKQMSKVRPLTPCELRIAEEFGYREDIA